MSRSHQEPGSSSGTPRKGLLSTGTQNIISGVAGILGRTTPSKSQGGLFDEDENETYTFRNNLELAKKENLDPFFFFFIILFY